MKSNESNYRGSAVVKNILDELWLHMAKYIFPKNSSSNLFLDKIKSIVVHTQPSCQHLYRRMSYQTVGYPLKQTQYNSTNYYQFLYFSLLEKCPYLEIFLSVFSRIRTENREIRNISAYSVRMRRNTDQKNSEYGHFSGSVYSEKKTFRQQKHYFSNMQPKLRKIPLKDYF